MAVDRIYARVEGEVTWLILNQPEKRNAISLDMISRGITLLKEFASENLFDPIQIGDHVFYRYKH